MRRALPYCMKLELAVATEPCSLTSPPAAELAAARGGFPFPYSAGRNLSLSRSEFRILLTNLKLG
jgi:hypothetical protein